MKKRKLQKGRVAHVRDICCKAIDYDVGKVPEPAMTDRQWLAWSVINILDGKIDNQIIAEIRDGQH